jgi:hypothetical protein|tara:strand:+ start:2676 stop:3125 length:450 start_codon:yes stop_codon:yes gene_type:complete
MMSLNDILESWKKDSVIDDSALDEDTVKTSKLHAKYLEIYSLSKLQLRKKEFDLEKIKKDKWLYYTGKMTKSDMDARGWAYDPFQGMSKPLKSEMSMYYETDEDLVKVKAGIDYQKSIIDTLEEIMNNIRWRHSHIKNIIEFRKFTSGM